MTLTFTFCDWIDIVGMILVLCVMCEAEYDDACRKAPLWMQWIRRLCFGSIALLLLNAILEDNSQPSLLLLVWFGIAKMAINALALFKRRSRTPTDDGTSSLHGIIYPDNALRGAGIMSRNARRPY